MAHMQVNNLTTNTNVKIDFTSPDFGMTKIITWECHMDDSTKSGYDMILGRSFNNIGI